MKREKLFIRGLPGIWNEVCFLEHYYHPALPPGTDPVAGK